MPIHAKRRQAESQNRRLGMVDERYLKQAEQLLFGELAAALENWYYGQITRGEPLYPPEYGKVLTSAVSLDEVRQTLQSYSYSVCYAVTAEPGTQGKGGSEDVE